MNRNASKVPQNTTLRLLVRGLRNDVTGWVTDASVNITSVVDKYTGDAIGVSLPIVCAYVGDYNDWTDSRGRKVFETDGNYMGLIPADSGMQAAQIALVTVVVVSSVLVRTYTEELIITDGQS